MIEMQKAFAYILYGERILLFREPDFPEAGFQVPAGTVDPGESPEQTLWREVEEETGLGPDTFDPEATHLGVRHYVARKARGDERHERHFFALRVRAGLELPETWEHAEVFGVDAPVTFEFFWVEPARARELLVTEHDALLDELSP